MFEFNCLNVIVNRKENPFFLNPLSPQTSPPASRAAQQASLALQLVTRVAAQLVSLSHPEISQFQDVNRKNN
jgi:hypothetical protein